MQELMQKRKEQLAQATITQLRRRGFEAEWFDTAAQAREAALQLLPEGCTVAWGGSATIREMGLTQAVHAGNWTVIDRDLARTPKERADLHRRGLLSDWYLMSANAISAEGVLVNIDGTGNRLAALCYGPRQILVLCSADKILPTTEAAIGRARNTAAPANALRFGGKTPCAADGLCHNCLSPDCICSQLLLTRACRPAGPSMSFSSEKHWASKFCIHSRTPPASHSKRETGGIFSTIRAPWFRAAGLPRQGAGSPAGPPAGCGHRGHCSPRHREQCRTAAASASRAATRGQS